MQECMTEYWVFERPLSIFRTFYRQLGQTVFAWPHESHLSTHISFKVGRERLWLQLKKKRKANINCWSDEFTHHTRAFRLSKGHSSFIEHLP